LLVGRFRGRNLAVGARNIRNLIADLANHLRGLQAFLLFLFVKKPIVEWVLPEEELLKY
ncbi:hypothetical protein H8V75_20515, partial [Enterobacter roggenkampii]|nr:hypothetical protein [Enterobacter roggenkampii]MCC7590395.1 hypothetical protein [Enterobacter roggenkampii]MCC7595225.1 hypothetical protein [Enterobacter roggenkampii]MCC7605391.1 hypothetical protein [Enterobacter roggenkampii]MCC7609848.1 hypothetical protein [Enterobacter roggenkampii]